VTPAVLGTGSALPDRRVHSEAVEAAAGLEKGWIERRTGVRERPVAAPDEATSDLASRAGARALEASGVGRASVRLLLLATSTPDEPLPPTAPRVAHALGLEGAGAVDLAGACAGFVYALALADAFCRIQGGSALVVGANVLSRRVDPRGDPATAFLFSDGAGAIVLGPRDGDSGLLAVHLGADGSRADMLSIPAGGSRRPLTPEALSRGEHYMRIRDGQWLFREAVRSMVDAGRRVLTSAGLEPADVDFWVPHQANRRITREAGRLLDIPPERTVDVIDRYGNSSAATIPVALDHAARSGRLVRGEIVLLTAFGAGLVSAGAVVRW
jgi:3-oxoacyl-[acyl-carrier-protein] synthase III